MELYCGSCAHDIQFEQRDETIKMNRRDALALLSCFGYTYTGQKSPEKVRPGSSLWSRIMGDVRVGLSITTPHIFSE